MIANKYIKDLGNDEATVMRLGILLFKETLMAPQIAGAAIICASISIGSLGSGMRPARGSTDGSEARSRMIE